MEHVDAFARYSRFGVWPVNTELGDPRFVSESDTDFEVIVLHYSLFVPPRYGLTDRLQGFLANSEAYKIAFFQDEHRDTQQRFRFLNTYRVDCVWTLLEPAEWPKVYGKHTQVPRLVHTIPGFASDRLAEKATLFAKPEPERTVDIGYRARDLPYHYGVGALEKSDIARGVIERAEESNLKIDVSVAERDRIYGDDWFAFLGNCKATLGTEAGVSIFDTDGLVSESYARLLSRTPRLGRAETLRELLPYENKIYYRTISPRHFEAAALNVCQLMYEGKYSGAMEPMVHYIPLAKDFSNWDEAIARFRDDSLRREITSNANRDLIASGRYSYRSFIEQFDESLIASGFHPHRDAETAALIKARVAQHDRGAIWRARLRTLLNTPFPGRRTIGRLLTVPHALTHRDWRATISRNR